MSSWWCWLKCWFSIADCQITKGYPNKYLHNFDCEIPEISHSYAWWYIYSSWQPTHVAIVKGLKIQPWELGDIKGYYTHIDIIYYIYNISFKLYIYIYTHIYIYSRIWTWVGNLQQRKGSLFGALETTSDSLSWGWFGKGFPFRL